MVLNYINNNKINFNLNIYLAIIQCDFTMSSSNSSNVSEFIRGTLNDIKDMSALNQVVIGGTAGLTTGYGKIFINFINKRSKTLLLPIGHQPSDSTVAEHCQMEELEIE